MKIDINIADEGLQPVKASFDLPQCWDEVSPLIYPHLVDIYLQTDQKLDKYDRTVRAFALLSAEAWNAIKLLEPEELYDLLPYVDWVFDRLDLRKNPMPSITINAVDYVGPSDELENLRFGEWCAADTFYMNYVETDDIFHLQQLAAVLYRPAAEGPEYTPGNAAYRGDTREKFNDQLLKHRSAIMATLPESTLRGIYLFFASTRKLVIGEYSHVFPQQSKNQAKDKSGWLDIYDDLRSDNKYIGPDRLDEEFLHSVLFSLERSNIKMAKLKEDHDI